MNRKKLVLLGCILGALAANAETLTVEQRLERLEKLLEQQMKENAELRRETAALKKEKANLKAEKKEFKEAKKELQLARKELAKKQEQVPTATVTPEIETKLSKLEKEMDLWELHGYASLQYRSTDNWSSTGTNFAKGDFFMGIPGTGDSANQVELVAKRKFYGKDGVFGDLNLRAEYGNGDSYFYSSSGSEHDNGKGNFEVKEAFINMGGFNFLPKDSTIWAGRRFLNRNATLLSGEFYKQSSGVGFGFERKGLSLGVVAADPGERDGKNKSKIFDDGVGRRTVTSFDFNYAGIKVPGGTLDVGAKYYIQPNANKIYVDESASDIEKAKNGDFAKNGFGVGLVYNTNYYGFKDGWAQHSINYGYGVGAHATGGMNFGQWTDGAVKHAYTTLATTGGVVNLNKDWQLGTELTAMHGDKLYGLSGHLTRVGFSLQPSYKVNDNFRMVFGATVGIQRVEDYKENWGGLQKETQVRYGFSIAPTFTADSDFFGRPQIQPFVTWMHTNFDSGFGGDLGDDKSQVVFGVKSEVWF